MRYSLALRLFNFKAKAIGQLLCFGQGDHALESHPQGIDGSVCRFMVSHVPVHMTARARKWKIAPFTWIHGDRCPARPAFNPDVKHVG